MLAAIACQHTRLPTFLCNQTLAPGGQSDHNDTYPRVLGLHTGTVSSPARLYKVSCGNSAHVRRIEAIAVFRHDVRRRVQLPANSRTGRCDVVYGLQQVVGLEGRPGMQLEYFRDAARKCACQEMTRRQRSKCTTRGPSREHGKAEADRVADSWVRVGIR